MHYGECPWLNPLMAPEVTFFILWTVSKSIGRVMKIFLQLNPKGVDFSAIKQELGLFQNVEDIHDVHASSLDGKYYMFSLQW